MSAFEPGFRRTGSPDPGALEHEPELVARIRAEIAEHGPITVARFMERALYEPGLGYYRRATPGPGLAGADFLTSPEAHPIFGAVLGRVLEDAWQRLDRPEPFVVTEPGAGTGALAHGLLDGLRRRRAPLLEAIAVRPLEVEDARVAAFADRLTEAGFGARLRLKPPPPTAVESGAVIANEVADALPVHRVVRRGGVLRERLVTTTADGFAELDAEPTTPALAARLEAEGIALADGQLAEICLALEPWLAGATRHLARGLVLVVDYGEDAASLYRPDRREGTLRGFARHAVTGDPYRAVGRQDLTAHVDLTALRAAADAVGLELLAETRQAELLAALGTELAADELHGRDATLEGALRLRSGLARLLDPRGMGGFRVLAFGRGLPAEPPLAGFGRSPGPQGPPGPTAARDDR